MLRLREFLSIDRGVSTPKSSHDTTSGSRDNGGHLSNRMTPRQLFYLVSAVCLLPYLPIWAGLLIGVAWALAFGNPCPEITRPGAKKLLALSIVGLGAGMDLGVVAKTGVSGVGYTFVGILATLGLGTLFARWIRVPGQLGLLISVGTAICGGSAIAAVAAVLDPPEEETSLALATVFLLNACALLFFPSVGSWIGLDARQFGLWSALAIHDTSSVVGAAIQYGGEALEVATTVKLARALWIVPLALSISAWKHSSSKKKKITFPWFIVGFLVAAALVTYFPVLRPAGQWVNALAKRLMVVTLFWIGMGFSPQAIKKVGFRPIGLGLSLWLVVGAISLLAIYEGWIR